MGKKWQTAFATAALVPLVGGAAWAQDGLDKSRRTSGPTRVIGETATVYIPIVPCRVVDTRSAAATGEDKGPLAPNEQRALRVYDGAGYVGQGGASGQCGIGGDSIAVEASITAIGPSANGYLRAWPTSTPVPNATFLNYSRGMNITNTGAISVSDGDSEDLTIRNYNATTHLVIDIQGYYAPVATE